MREFDITNWFWIVGDDESRYWSSKEAAYVSALPDGAGLSRIANEVELNDVLLKQAPKLAMTRTFTPDEVMAALYRIDAGATEAAFTVDEIANPTVALAGRLGALAADLQIDLGEIA